MAAMFFLGNTISVIILLAVFPPRIGVPYYVVELDITGFLRLRLFIILEDLVV